MEHNKKHKQRHSHRHIRSTRDTKWSQKHKHRECNVVPTKVHNARIKAQCESKPEQRRATRSRERRTEAMSRGCSFSANPLRFENLYLARFYNYLNKMVGCHSTLYNWPFDACGKSVSTQSCRMQPVQTTDLPKQYKCLKKNRRKNDIVILKK